MSKYSAILFDLDGTLTDSQEGILKSLKYALSHYNIERTDDQLIKYIGPPISDIFRDLLQTDDKDEIKKAVQIFRERYHRIGYLENAVYDGVFDMLNRLKSADVKLAVATSKPQKFATLILENFKLTGYFDVICGPTMDGKLASKPDIIRKVLSELNSTDAVMVGDRFYDLAGASQVGIDCIGAGYGYAKGDELERYPHIYIAKSPKEIADFILN